MRAAPRSRPATGQRETTPEPSGPRPAEERTPIAVGDLGGLLQARLRVSSPTDGFELEAERSADEFVGAIHRTSVQRRTPTSAARREQPGAGLEGDGGGLRASADVSRAIGSAAAGGAPLASSDRSRFEGFFGADLGGVRVHADRSADDLCRSIDAEAFTTGRHVFFSEGSFAPGSAGGDHLLAHELTHVVQQGGAPVARKGGWGKLREAVKAGDASDLVTENVGGKAGFEDEQEISTLEAEEMDKEEDEAGSESEGGEEEEEDKKKLAIGGSWEKKRVQAEQEGFVDGIGSVGIDKDGIDAGGIDLADDWTIGFRLGKGQQKVEFEAPTELKIPPPDGFELELAKVVVPIAPGVWFEVSVQVEGGAELANTKVGLEHLAANTDVEQLDRFKVSGAGEFGAGIAIIVELAMGGGVPVIAAVRGGLRTKAEAEAKLELEAGGLLDIRRTVPVKGEKPAVTSKDGEIYMNVVGSGALTAALSAFLGYEFFTMKGDLYELVIAEAPIAGFDLGARFGMRYQDGTGKPFAEKVGEDWMNFEWLFGKLWKARKLDAATESATNTKADVAALLSLKGRPDLQTYLKSLEANDKTFDVANGEMQLLLNEESTLSQLVTADKEGITSLQSEITTTLAAKNAEVKSKRWAITNFFRGDIPELKSARKKMEAMQKTLGKNEKKLTSIQERKLAAKQRFLTSLDPARIDEMLAQAHAKADATYKQNWKLFSQEFDAARAKNVEAYEKAREEIEAQDVLLEGLRDRIAAAKVDPTSVDVAALESQLGKANAQRSLLTARLAKTRRLATEQAQQQLDLLRGVGVAMPEKKDTGKAAKFEELVGKAKKGK